MAGEQEVANTIRPRAEPLADPERPADPDQDWLPGLTAGDDDERRQLLRELVIRALV